MASRISLVQLFNNVSNFEVLSYSCARVQRFWCQVSGFRCQNSICWELNEHDKDKVPPECHGMWYQVFQIALDAGVKLIYGSDSHFTHEIGQTEFVEQILRELPDGCLETPSSIGLLERSG